MTPSKSATTKHSSSGAERPWSYSQLNAFENCPKKWAAETFYKSVKRKEGEQQNYGKEVHDHFDKFAAKDMPLPLDLQHHGCNIEGLRKTIPGGKVVTEQRIAINRAFEPTGFFDDDVWCRGVIDFMLYTPEKALIVDWKTGKVRPDFDQLDLMAALTQCLVPTLKRIVGAFYWTKEKNLTTKTYPLSAHREIWQSFLPRVNEFQRRVAEQDFPARPNFLCRKHCPVTGCEHNGVG